MRISASEDARFYDEGEDVWPKKLCDLGRLVAVEPDPVAFVIIDKKSIRAFMPSVNPLLSADAT